MLIIEECENELKSKFEEIDEIAYKNQLKVLNSFQELKVSTRHFAGTSGYGYDDIGRDTLCNLYAKVFGAESAIVSPLLTCGSHAISLVLYGLLRPNDILLSVTGAPYDTLLQTIGNKSDENKGSLADFGVQYKQIDYTENDAINFRELEKQLSESQPKVVYLQRSRGYTMRKPLEINEIKKIVSLTRKISPSSFIVVDNCYGEFVCELEPSDVGVDVVVGSLIKNPGGGLAQTGGYIAGSKKAIELISYRLTNPSLGLEVGSYEQGYRNFYQGLFLAPHVVAQSIKGALLVGKLFSKLGFRTFPTSTDCIGDIIQSIVFDTKEQLIKFVQLVQQVSPVDSYAIPQPWSMPGYDDEVIMAAGTFVSGASIELSCDSPIKKPYVAYFQGGLTYEHVRILAQEIIKNRAYFEKNN